MSNGKEYKGSCLCGAVRFTVSGEPAAMGYCHCASCRHWPAGPVNAFTLWKPDAVKVTSGDEAADQGRTAEDEGRPGGNGRLGRQRAGMSAPGIAIPAGRR